MKAIFPMSYDVNLKASYNKSNKTKQIKTEAFAFSKKYENQIYYQQNKAKLQGVRKQYYLENKNDIKKQKKHTIMLTFF